jgi:hypothetical protein
MVISMCRLLTAFGVVVLGGGLCAAQADDVDAVKEKLFQAKKAYDADVQKYRKAVGDWLDKREDEARKAGDKKLVDKVKADRQAFEKNGDPPVALPKDLRILATNTRSALEKAYAAAVKDYVKLKEDTAADLVEKERQEFLKNTAATFGKPLPSAEGKDELRRTLSGTTWDWDDGLTLKADGSVDQKTWAASGLVARWEVVDRRTVVIIVDKGRNVNRVTVLTFSEDLSSFAGIGFEGDRMDQKKKKP